MGWKGISILVNQFAQCSIDCILADHLLHVIEHHTPLSVVNVSLLVFDGEQGSFLSRSWPRERR